MMKLAGWACAGVLLLAPGAFAHEAAASEREARLEAARDVVERFNIEDMFVEMLEVMLPMIEPSIRQGWPEADNQQVRDAMNVFGRAFTESTPEFVDEMVGVYAQTFTLRELEAIVAFLQTPEGARFAEMQIPLSRQGQVVGERVGTRIGDRYGAEIEAIMTRNRAD
jgi:hypothetical protein